MGSLEGADAELPVEGHLPPFEGATGWLNSSPLTPAGLRGKAVAVNFCTFTCINWIRTLPYVRAWAQKYADRRLVMIGVHTPEFSVEKDVDNVRRALRRMGVEYPIALDDDYAVWEAFSNHYWPALYLVDAEGRIRHHWFGEGDYERSELVIQQLLADSGGDPPDGEFVTVDARGPEAEADWMELQSPETYLGYGRTENFRSPERMTPEERREYTAPESLGLNDWALSGDWTVRGEGAVLDGPGGRIAFKFHARDLHLVMGPAGEAPVRFRVTIDEKPPGDAAGGDVDGDGNGLLDQPRMYQLIRQPYPITDRRFEIEFLGTGATGFVFTFG